jgi:hypothetical protein
MGASAEHWLRGHREEKAPRFAAISQASTINLTQCARIDISQRSEMTKARSHIVLNCFSRSSFANQPAGNCIYHF